MTEKDSQGKKKGDGKATLIILLLIFAIVLSAWAVLVIYFPSGHWWSANTANNIVSTPSPMLETSVAVLTILVAIIAIYMGLTFWVAKRDWEKFEIEQKPIIEDTKKELEKLKEETKEINWLDQLRKSMKEDPHLDSGNAKDTIRGIKEHYFGRDKYNEAWEYFGVARWYEKDERYEKEKRYTFAIKYYGLADIVDLEEDDIDSNDLRKHIRQSLGLDYFQRGLQLEAKGKNADAIKDYEAAIVPYDWIIKTYPHFAEAHRNKATTLIQLGKIEGDKTEPYNDAIYCYKEAIECLKKIEDNYDHFYDKARAYALLEQRYEAIESLTRAFNLALAELDNLGTLLNNLDRYREDFKNVEEDVEFKALEKRYRDIYKGTN